ncbi:MAG: alpha/beta hydrolase family protein [Flavobacteriaceae bacterium]
MSLRILLLALIISSNFSLKASLPNADKKANLKKDFENPFIGRWQGKATDSNEETEVILDISNHKALLSASISLMDMGVMGWPAKDIQLKGNQIVLRFPTDTSDQIIMLTLARDADGNDYLKGTWQDTQIEEIAQIRLEKQLSKAAFSTEAVNIEGPAGALSAEVITPPGEGPFPGVVFLHGSGPQPKDTNRFAAYALAGQGIASIIFDKRGVGKSEGYWRGANFKDLARDGVAVATYFISLDVIDYVGFFGHSQGGWIGPLAANLWDESAFVISSAGPAVSPSREAHWSFIYRARKAGANEKDIEAIRKVVDHWHNGLRNAEWQPYKTSLEEIKLKPWFDASGLQYLQYPPEPEELKYYLPFMDFDPIPVLHNLKKPLYAVLTPDDESIDALETEYILREIKQLGKDIRIKLYPGYNHGFRKIGAERQIRWAGFPEDYFILQAEFVKSIQNSK